MTSINFRVSSGETELLRANTSLSPQAAENFNCRLKSLIAELLEDWKQIEVLEKSITDKFYFELCFNSQLMPVHLIHEEEFDNNLIIEQQELFQKLTWKEVSILVFIYKGYRQREVSFILQMAINTFRHHRKSLYKKMGFRNKIEMAGWCNKYLKRFFVNVNKIQAK